MRFPQAAIDYGRKLTDANLPDTCTAITPGEFVPDGEGGGHYADGETQSFPCRRWPLDAKQVETLVDSQLREPGLEGLVFPVAVSLDALATLRIDRKETGETDWYQVKGVIPDPTFVILRRAIIKRIPAPSEAM